MARYGLPSPTSDSTARSCDIRFWQAAGPRRACRSGGRSRAPDGRRTKRRKAQGTEAPRWAHCPVRKQLPRSGASSYQPQTSSLVFKLSKLQGLKPLKNRCIHVVPEGTTHKSFNLLHATWPQNDRPVALLFLNFRFEHDGSGAGNSAILTYAPEMQRHENAGDQGNRDAMPDVRAQKRVGVHDRATQQCKTH